MRTGIALALATATALSACATPQQMCINRATRDLQNVDALIAETQANLARGYGYKSVNVENTQWVVCDWYQSGTNKKGKAVYQPQYCLDDYTTTVQEPVAIDPAAEQRKLKNLQDKRRSLVRAAEPAIAACRAQYPQ